MNGDPRRARPPAHTLSVAPMMEWTDRHCRVFHRTLSRHALLYTEMVPAAAVVHGDRERLLGFSAVEHPVALQLGGGAPEELAAAVRASAPFAYDEINLNVGCPSDRVQSGAFGACLMREPERVARITAAMIEASAAAGGPEITVKCRIGVDDQVPEEILPVFLDAIAAAGVRRVTIHARMAWLQGLSPKENRDVPPLDYALVREMKARRPDLTILLNGGLDSLAAAEEAGALQLDAAGPAASLDGAMFGRAAYHQPLDILGSADRRVFGEEAPDADPFDAARAMLPYIEAQRRAGWKLGAITRHMLGLFAGRPGARAYRRMLSENAHRPGAGPELLEAALDAMEARAA